MCHKIISSLAALPESLKQRGAGHYGHLNVAFYHHAEELEQESVQSEWYKIAYAKLIRLAHILKNVEQIDGRLTNRYSSSIITDDHIISYMKTFNSLAKAFIGSSSMQCAYKKGITSADRSVLAMGFHEPNKRDSMMLNSLTRVCDFLNISAQQRKSIRLTVCPQVTQHHIWRGALEQVLKDLKYEMNSLRCCSLTFQMGEQIVLSCIKFCADATYISSSVSPSWMRPAPLKKVEKPLPSRRWEEVLEMFVDLTKCLGQEEMLSHHVLKLEAMKEGLYQIKDILVERDISYKEARHEDCLIQKKLTKSLGHSSKCLFTLLLYYLYGNVRDIEIEVSGGVYETDGRFYLSIGKIVTSCDESMVWNGVKQLNRALGVFKFVWETAVMKGVLELQGHLWCMGAEEKILTYRGNVFYVHGMRP
ncbi:uncharacterized protein LOC103717219 [Phoenix dactylifera]|uniref:Uncharacterized protein LOC103717219 n=1 Tax=Phoenix dactylifera TaxID=42345 RepID=A0A8B7CPV3_PHODC|nr:uncharacterized protein LOC103717219 [Phoenix dactylifera]XP_008803748.2 uncharacterized protein LOC103717219 [Phoenix dactylifera]XP_026664287.2 uncharacterized protein LOC103717219 [Phoenix dactylifera]XP_038984807.1 uncharacterized protein LOC103717219 [Phoenix dactylifera]XP_038984808.1 uncharacterized protein LOC103717219 [Phoenix dactylifera]